MTKIAKSNPKTETWSWRDGEYIEGTDVTCVNHMFKTEERSFVSGTITPRTEHGWTTAASDYYYLITSGSGEVLISNDTRCTANQIIKIEAGQSFKIQAGTTYNYRANTDGLSFVLFMNNLWEE